MTLYDKDFFAWTVQQAAALRRVAGDRSNLPFDWEHLAEEIEGLGRGDWRALESELSLIIEHLLKLHHSPAVEPKRGWFDSVGAHRDAVRRLLRDNPSFRRRVDLADLYPEARRRAAASLRRYDGMEPAALPPDCPYRLDQILDLDWFPDGI